MEPMITNEIDPSLMRVLEKRRDTRDSRLERKRARAAGTPPNEGTADDNKLEPDRATPVHVDDMA